MALTTSNVLDRAYQIVGNQKEVVIDCTFDESYPEGGEALTASTLGLNYIDRADATITAVEGETNVANSAYDEENEKLQLFDETPGEIADEANAKGVVVRVTARGH